MKQYNLNVFKAVPTSWDAIERAELDSFVWGGAERAYKTYGQLAYVKAGDDSTGLYIRLFCEEKNPISVETKLDGMVCKDSCMEFFFSMREDDASENAPYLNIECNSLGVTHIGFGVERHGRVFLDSLGVERFPVSVDFSKDGWEILEFVPEEALKKIFGLFEVSEKTVMRGNFYKCDENANAPFASWSPVDAPKPDFHRPECFGNIVIC